MPDAAWIILAVAAGISMLILAMGFAVYLGTKCSGRSQTDRSTYQGPG